jgi:hypothetical protein
MVAAYLAKTCLQSKLAFWQNGLRLSHRGLARNILRD